MEKMKQVDKNYRVQVLDDRGAFKLVEQALQMAFERKGSKKSMKHLGTKWAKWSKSEFSKEFVKTKIVGAWCAIQGIDQEVLIEQMDK